MKKNDYVLSFSAHGVGVFVTDIHVDVYKELEVLYLIDKGAFKQFFTKSAYKAASDRGLEFYGHKEYFNNYKTDLQSFIDKFEKFFDGEIIDKEKLSIDTVKTFFSYTTKLCKDYTFMNVEYTDKAFSAQDSNPVVKTNLSAAAKFKDEVRSYMNKVLFEPDGYSNIIFTILGKQFKLEQSIFDNLTQKEILDIYKRVMPNVAKVSKRQKAFVINYDRKYILEGKEAKNILDEFSDKASSTTIVSGKVASRGRVTGPVKVINVDYSDAKLLNQEIAKMNVGDVLVAQTTAPELIVGCKKASAIVTDIGGLLSHAAIVSREFGIPCIVGTGNASKVFRDGDMVEVDAVNGTVKKI